MVDSEGKGGCRMSEIQVSAREQFRVDRGDVGNPSAVLDAAINAISGEIPDVSDDVLVRSIRISEPNELPAGATTNESWFRVTVRMDSHEQ